MPDLIDIILDRLSVSALESLDKINLNSSRQSRHYSKELETCLDTIERVYMNRCCLEVNYKTDELISKTRNYKSLFDKYTGQFEKLQEVRTSNSNSKKMRAYNQELNSMEQRLNELTKDSTGDLELEEIFIKIHDVHKKIEDFEIKISEIKERLKCYENFPASLTEAQYCVADLKNRIREKEASAENNLY